jgi:acetate kinase
LGFLGIELDEKRNEAGEGLISASSSTVAVRVIHTDEELMIARSVGLVLRLGRARETDTPNHTRSDKR